MIGFDLPGCFSEIAILPEVALVKVDDRISDSEAACLQSLSDSVAAVETAKIAVADTVVILGQGSMGLECLQIARLCGAGLIITVDVRDEACAMSRELGADYALNAKQCDVVKTIMELTEDIGADVVFECAGGSPKQGLAGHTSLLQAIAVARSGGKIVGVSFYGGPIPIDVDLLREQPALRVSRYQHPGASGTYGSPGRDGTRTAQAHDHACPVGLGGGTAIL